MKENINFQLSESAKFRLAHFIKDNHIMSNLYSSQKIFDLIQSIENTMIFSDKLYYGIAKQYSRSGSEIRIIFGKNDLIKRQQKKFRKSFKYLSA